MSRSLPIEFQPSALVERMILGAVSSDRVRLHGAIVAALEIHGTQQARSDVFAPALAAVRDHGTEVGGSLEVAIDSHLA